MWVWVGAWVRRRQRACAGVFPCKQAYKRAQQALRTALAGLHASPPTAHPTRRCPTEPDAVIEFFLDTPADDLEWMVVRHRPNLSVEFFKCVGIGTGCGVYEGVARPCGPCVPYPQLGSLGWLLTRARHTLDTPTRQLDTIIGQERFNPLGPDEERVNELDMLRKYLAEATESLDKWVFWSHTWREG